MYRRVLGFISFCASLCVFISFAEASATLNEQRYHYEMAKTALTKKDSARFAEHYSALSDYPLRVYLDYSQLLPLLKAKDLKEVDLFLRQNTNTYLEARLRSQLLAQLYADQRWQDFIFYYRANDDLAMRCRWLEARLKTEDLSAFDEVEPLWSQPRSQPKACDPLFSRWKAAGRLSEDAAWKRYSAAMASGNRSLARYSASTLGTSYAHYVEKYQRLDARPQGINRLEDFNIVSPEMQELIVFGIEKYARQDPLKSLETWTRYESRQIFPEELAERAKLALALQLIRKNHLHEVRDLIKVSPSLRRAEVMDKLAVAALKEQRWNDLLVTLDMMPDSSLEDDRWRYWRARALEASASAETDLAPIHALYADVAQNRSYYGFLASDHLGLEYSLRHQPAEVSEKVIDFVETIPAIQRAHELWLTDRTGEAYAEWMYGLREMSATELVAVGVLANRWGWHDKAIQAMIAGQHWNILNIRFPLAFENEILTASTNTQVQPDLIYAVVRQESAMAHNARSSAGAMGLMQLMPATASSIARKQGLNSSGKSLTDPEYNLALGTQYLDDLLNKFQGNRILATAAYNAGPHRVDRWLNEPEKSMPFDIWIESIPFKETQGYVKNVLTFSVIYSYRMGKPKPLLTEFETRQKL